MSLEQLHTGICEEIAEPTNPFAASVMRCYGYDVFGDVIRHAPWHHFVFLLFTGRSPESIEAALLNDIAIALGNPGPRDPSVHAAMCAGVAGVPTAGVMMGALAVGAGKVGGARDVFYAVMAWERCGGRFSELLSSLATITPAVEDDLWLPTEHIFGFDPFPGRTSGIVKACLQAVARHHTPAIDFLCENLQELEEATGSGLSFSGVAAAAFHDLKLDSQRAEALFLWLRLPGAIVHALEQQSLGHKQFPFGATDLEDSK